MGISKLYITDTLIHYWLLTILIDLIPITTYINSYDFMVYEWYIYIYMNMSPGFWDRLRPKKTLVLRSWLQRVFFWRNFWRKTQLEDTFYSILKMLTVEYGKTCLENNKTMTSYLFWQGTIIIYDRIHIDGLWR